MIAFNVGKSLCSILKQNISILDQIVNAYNSNPNSNCCKKVNQSHNYFSSFPEIL